MTVVFIILFIIAFVFASVCLYLSTKLHEANVRIELLEIKANYCEQSEKTLRKSVDIQTKCIRDLNDIMKKSVENKEATEPDTKALLAGWVIEEPESSSEQPRQIDVFRMQNLINSLNYRNITPLYPWQQFELDKVLGPYGIREERTNEKILAELFVLLLFIALIVAGVAIVCAIAKSDLPFWMKLWLLRG